jgi:Protein of unknown function (DUF2510)
MRSADRKLKDHVDQDLLAAFRDLPPDWYRDPDYPTLARYWDGATLHTERRRVTGPKIKTSDPQTPSPRPALPAWYPDPTDGASLRYWDGSQWTGQTQSLERHDQALERHTQALERHTQALGPLATINASAARHNTFTSTRAKLITAVAAVVAALAIVGAMSYVDKKPIELSTDRGSNSNSVSPSGTLASTPTHPASDPKAVTGSCPTGAPQASTSMSSQLQPGGDNSWVLTLTGVVTNDATANVQPFYVAAQIVGANGAFLDEPFLLPSSGTDVGLGQSVVVTGQATITSSVAPTLGPSTTYWTWFDLQDATCPSNP